MRLLLLAAACSALSAAQENNITIPVSAVIDSPWVIRRSDGSLGGIAVDLFLNLVNRSVVKAALGVDAVLVDWQVASNVATAAAYGELCEEDDADCDYATAWYKGNGTLRLLETRQVWAGVGLRALTEDTAGALSYTLPFATGGQGLLVKADAADAVNPWTFITPFTPKVWASIFGMVSFCTLAFWLIDRMSPHGHWKAGDLGEARHRVGFLSAAWFGGLTWLGKDLEAYPRSLSGRTAMLGFFVFALFINAAYDSSLNALTVAKGLNKGVRSWDDLVKQNAAFGVVAGSMTEAFLRDNIRPLLRRMAQNARPYPTLDAAVAALRARDIPAVVAPSLNLRSVALTAPCEVTMADLPLSLDFFPFYTPYYYANETEAAEAADASDDPELELQQRDWAIALQKAMAEAEAEGVPASLADAYYASMQSPCPGADISAYAAPSDAVDQGVLGFQGIFFTALVTWGIALLVIVPIERSVWRCRGRSWCCFKTAVSMGWHVEDSGSDDDDGATKGATGQAKALGAPVVAAAAASVRPPAVAAAAPAAAAPSQQQPVHPADVTPTLISAVAVVDAPSSAAATSSSAAHTNVAVRPSVLASPPPGVPAGHMVASDGSWSASNPMAAKGRTPNSK